MKTQLVLTKINEKQFETLFPLKEHSEIIKTLDDFEQYNRFNSDGEEKGLYVGYFIIDNVFNIIHIPIAKHFGDAAQQAMNAIVLPKINEYYTKGIKNVAANDTEKESNNE